jgi:hypothetical protein
MMSGPITPEASAMIEEGIDETMREFPDAGVLEEPAAGGSIFIENFDSTYPGANGSILTVSGSYESQ